MLRKRRKAVKQNRNRELSDVILSIFLEWINAPTGNEQYRAWGQTKGNVIDMCEAVERIAF